MKEPGGRGRRNWPFRFSLESSPPGRQISPSSFSLPARKQRPEGTNIATVLSPVAWPYGGPPSVDLILLVDHTPDPVISSSPQIVPSAAYLPYKGTLTPLPIHNISLSLLLSSQARSCERSLRFSPECHPGLSSLLTQQLYLKWQPINQPTDAPTNQPTDRPQLAKKQNHPGLL